RRRIDRHISALHMGRLMAEMNDRAHVLKTFGDIRGLQDRARDLIAQGKEDRRDAAHARPADADEMHPLHVPQSLVRFVFNVFQDGPFHCFSAISSKPFTISEAAPGREFRLAASPMALSRSPSFRREIRVRASFSSSSSFSVITRADPAASRFLAFFSWCPEACG